jgi:hypothetical protein
MAKYIADILSIDRKPFVTEQEIHVAIGARLVCSHWNCRTENVVIAASRNAGAILVRNAPACRRKERIDLWANRR